MVVLLMVFAHCYNGRSLNLSFVKKKNAYEYMSLSLNKCFDLQLIFFYLILLLFLDALPL